MRMRFKLGCLFVALALISSCGRGASPGAPLPADPGKATAVVKSDEATFTIPVGRRAVWQWYLADTKPNAMEYKVDIKADETRAFGFYLFKRQGTQPKSGSLSDLIASGQTNVWAPVENGGGSMVKGVWIFAEAASDNSAVTLFLRDQQIIHELREKKPPIVQVAVRTPPTDEQNYSIPVKYEN